MSAGGVEPGYTPPTEQNLQNLVRTGLQRCGSIDLDIIETIAVHRGKVLRGTADGPLPSRAFPPVLGAYQQDALRHLTLPGKLDLNQTIVAVTFGSGFDKPLAFIEPMRAGVGQMRPERDAVPPPFHPIKQGLANARSGRNGVEPYHSTLVHVER